ncbi:MAG: EAL domain-containing protein [Thiovulaceae bacterium]|nr:EAL domain-containing protein [Sulfurimonadaceae bacterium]
MTLYKQLGSITALFLTLVLTTIMLLNFNSSQRFIQNQLHANAEDTAASLALALAGVADNTAQAEVAMKTMISAIFDRGFYESITLTHSSGKIVHKDKTALILKEVPSWFISMITLQAPSAQSEINQGWETYGHVSVTSHVGHGYIQLWDVFIDLLQTFLLLSIVFLTLLALLIKIILRPLQSIESQAKAIQNHEFLIVEKIPFTTEFRHVVRAMNSMVGKVKEIFDKEAQSLEKYHELLYIDTQTSLYNRKYLLLKLSSFLDAQTQLSQGSFVLLSFNDLNLAKKQLGYQKFENLLKNFAKELQIFCEPLDDTIVARMNDNDFALLIPSQNLDNLKEKLSALLFTCAGLIKEHDLEKILYLSIGAVSYDPEGTQKNLFSKADLQLAKAKIKNESAIEFSTNDSESPTLFLGKEEWIAMLNSSLEENMLKLAAQKVLNIKETSSVLHHEVYLRMIEPNGTIHSAGHFLPMLINLQLTDEVDKHVINAALHHGAKDSALGIIAININADFLKNSENFSWLSKRLESFTKEFSTKIHFEASNFSVTKNIATFSAFSSMLKKLGLEFGIDNFSIGSDGLDFLTKIKPHYLKANKSFFLDLKSDKSKSANDSLSILAGSIGMRLIATNIESQKDVDDLTALDIEYLQGSFLDTPTIIGE